MISDIKLIRSKILEVINQNKGQDIVAFDLKNKTIIAKYMIISSGVSSQHVKALSKLIIENLKQYDRVDVEGISEGNWVIVSFRGIMVHIFRPEVRLYYKIEELWSYTK